MKKQVFNPYLPSYEYVPDTEPHIFGDRVYIYGSHDEFDGRSFCLLDYVCWSAPVNDLSDWRYEGVIYRRAQDPKGKKGILNAMYAPDVCRGADGRYYLYYFIAYSGLISVAVCDEPAGKYEFLGYVKYPDGSLLGSKKEPLQFDPGVFVDDDGKVYMYTGFGPVNYPSFLLGGHKASEHGAMGFELDTDMLTVKQGPIYIGVKGKKEGKGTPYEGHEFFEASSLRKFGGKYYFVYSSCVNHELCYAVSDNPLGGFEYGGVLVSIGDVGIDGVTADKARGYLGNTHGGMLNIGDDYYIFYHRQTNRNSFSRQACAEKLEFDGEKFAQARLTSCGLNGGPLAGKGEYSAHIACNLFSKKGTYFCGVFKKRKGCYPYLTQSGKDRDCDPDQYIANLCDGATAVYRYFDIDGASRIDVKVRGKGGGKIIVRANGEPAAEIDVPRGNGERVLGADLTASGVCELSFTYVGKGRVDFIAFTLA